MALELGLTCLAHRLLLGRALDPQEMLEDSQMQEEKPEPEPEPEQVQEMEMEQTRRAGSGDLRAGCVSEAGGRSAASAGDVAVREDCPRREGLLARYCYYLRGRSELWNLMPFRCDHRHFVRYQGGMGGPPSIY